MRWAVKTAGVLENMANFAAALHDCVLQVARQPGVVASQLSITGQLTLTSRIFSLWERPVWLHSMK